jgi:hypothetical protein
MRLCTTACADKRGDTGESLSMTVCSHCLADIHTEAIAVCCYSLNLLLLRHSHTVYYSTAECLPSPYSSAL